MTATITTMGMIKTQFKRELWENKTAFFYAPLFVSGFVLILIFCGLFYVQKNINTYSGTSGQHSEQSKEISKEGEKNSYFLNWGNEKPSGLKIVSLSSAIKDNPGFIGFPIGAVTAINGSLLSAVFLISLIIYSSSCLFDDRKNRDILFWRSMPVSELTNVLVKLAVIVCVAPVVILLLNVAIGLITFIATIVFSLLNGVSLVDSWKSIVAANVAAWPLRYFVHSFLMLIVLLPIYSFNLLCSAYAKKSPFFTGALIPIVFIVLDILAQKLIGLNLHVVDTFTSYGKALGKFFMMISTSKYSLLDSNTAMIVMASFALAALFLYTTIWLRNNRYEI